MMISFNFILNILFAFSTADTSTFRFRFMYSLWFGFFNFIKYFFIFVYKQHLNDSSVII
jgi:hypothetical protein